MKIAIYDIESTGAITEWSSIIEIGGVLIDENFNEIDRFNLRGRIPEGEIPQAKALLVNGTTIDQLTKSNLSNSCYSIKSKRFLRSGHQQFLWAFPI